MFQKHFLLIKPSRAKAQYVTSLQSNTSTGTCLKAQYFKNSAEEKSHVNKDSWISTKKIVLIWT